MNLIHTPKHPHSQLHIATLSTPFFNFTLISHKHKDQNKCWSPVNYSVCPENIVAYWT